jgi:hypothetical protein
MKTQKRRSPKPTNNRAHASTSLTVPSPERFKDEAGSIVAAAPKLSDWLERRSVTVDELPEVVDTLSVVLKLIKQVKAKADEYKKPLNKLRSLVLADEKALMEPLKDLEHHLKYNLLEPCRAKEAKKERAKAERQAKSLEKKGEEERAAAVREAAVPSNLNEKLGMDRLTTRKQYTYEVKDFAALVCAVAGGQAPLEALEPSHRFLAEAVKVAKSEGQLYPGVEGVVRNIHGGR